MPARQPPPFRTPFLGKNGLVEPNVWQRYLADQSIGPSGAAPADARFLVTTANTNLPNDTNLGALSTGYLFITVGAGIAVVSSTDEFNAAGLTGTLPDDVFPDPLPPLSGENLTDLDGAEVTHSVVTKTFLQTGYEAQNDQTVLVNAAAGVTTILLPSSPDTGWTATVKKIDVSANLVTVDGNGATIDGIATQDLLAQWNSLSVISNGTNWFVTAVV